MGADAYAGFEWLFTGFSDQVISGLILLEPIIAAVAMPAAALTGSAMTVWLILVLVRMAQVGLYQSIATGTLVAVCIGWGFQVVTYQAEGRGAVKMLQIQKTALSSALNIYGIFSSSLSATLAGHRAGSIIPASAAIEDAVARHAALYEGTDLAKLIRDYNQQCSPLDPLVGSEATGRRQEYQAVGLLGGGALGIPDEHYNSLDWISDAAQNSRPESSGVAGTLFAAAFGWLQQDRSADRGINVWDMAERRERVNSGIELLEGIAFTGSNYALPTREHWQSIFSDSDGARTYLRVSDAQFDAHSMVAEPDSSVFTPHTCAEAYRVANLGAQEAYHAMTSLGKPVGVPYTATAGDLLAGGVAWQRLYTRGITGGSANPSESAKTGGAILAWYQSGKDWLKFLELRTLLPVVVVASAYALSLTIVVAPIFLIAAFIFGMKPIMTWLSCLFFFIFFVIFAQIITVAASLALASLALIQTGAALGWHGGGEEFDVLRAVLGALAGVFLALAGWLASQLTGASVQAMAAAGRRSVSAASDALSATAKLVGGVALARNLARGARGPGGAQSAARSASVESARQTAAATQAVRNTAARQWGREQSGAAARARDSESFRAAGWSLNPPRPPSKPQE